MLNQTSADYYNILQVHHDAEKDVIDAAYRCLSKMYHPDLNRAPAAAERMKEINIAYQAVGNEASRKEYHRQWMQKNAWKTLPEWGGGRTRAAEGKEAYRAFETLDSFFRETLNEKWGEAYERLTADDREKVGFQDFLEWKRAVHAVYRLGNYHISYFRRYGDCRYGDRVYSQIFHFIVRVTELQLVTGQIAESSSHKYVAMDGGALRVCLGNRDLKPITEKFGRLARMMAKNDIDEALVRAVNKIDAGTGVLAREGWVEEAERESDRSRRYGRPFCLGVIAFSPRLPEDGTLHGEESLERNMAYVSDFLAGHIRKTDVLGRCSDLALALLFPETKPRGGKRALEKLARLLRGDGYIKSNFPCQISAAIKPVKGAVGDELEQLLKRLGGDGGRENQ
ncbi:MAG: DnaJ domain-containing protein [Clostridiales Family XIII bacterium]|jgi:GGDEF domain-containing protein|nr:DnaJ domain-containing protein [Clostridiales Family XIII bacterium]